MTEVFENHFKPQVITEAVRKASKTVLKHQGAILRRSARGLIRTKKQPSKPGQPPRNATGKLRNNILYAFDDSRDEVFVGPRKFTNAGAQKTLEFGGAVPVPQGWRKRRFGVGLPGNAGGHGPMAILDTPNRWTRPYGYGTKDPKSFGADFGWSNEVYVIWRRLRSRKEVHTAGRHYARLLAMRFIRPTAKKQGKVEPRPYMSAALQKCREKLVELWRDAVG